MTDHPTPEEDYETSNRRYQTWFNSQDPAPPTAPPALNATAQELQNWSDALADVQCWFMGFSAATKISGQEIDTPEDIGSLQDLRELKKRLDGLLPEHPR